MYCGLIVDCRLFPTVPPFCMICCSKNTFLTTVATTTVPIETNQKSVAFNHYSSTASNTSRRIPQSNDLMKQRVVCTLKHVARVSRGNENALSQFEHPPLWPETVQQLHVIKSQARHAYPIRNVPVLIDE
jgi:hypothetical protein